jgi:DNA-binding CsgD family transcriptional regulator
MNTPATIGPLSLLTGAERQVAIAVADGLSNRDVAARLFISPKTVEHLCRVYQKDLGPFEFRSTTSKSCP